MDKPDLTPREMAKSHILAGAIERIRELEADFYPVIMGAPSLEYPRGKPLSPPSYDRKVIKQMKKMANGMARDLGADDPFD